MFLSHRRGDRLAASMDILSSVQEQHLLVWRDFYSEGLLSGRDKGSEGPWGHKTCEWLRIKEEKAFRLRRKGKEKTGRLVLGGRGRGQRDEGNGLFCQEKQLPRSARSREKLTRDQAPHFMLTRARGQAGFRG